MCQSANVLMVWALLRRGGAAELEVSCWNVLTGK
jgi:hypothetical protein